MNLSNRNAGFFFDMDGTVTIAAHGFADICLVQLGNFDARLPRALPLQPRARNASNSKLKEQIELDIANIQSLFAIDLLEKTPIKTNALYPQETGKTVATKTLKARLVL
jgi:hypothetical protein